MKEKGYFKHVLVKHTDVTLKSDKFILAFDFSPFNPKYANKKFELFQSEFKNGLLKRQNGICRICGGPLLFDDKLEVHHLLGKDVPE